MTTSCNLRPVGAPLVALLLVAAFSAAAIAQSAPPPAGAPAAQPTPPTPAAAAQSVPAQGFPAQPPPANDGGGFIHQLGVWWKDGFGDFNKKMQSARDKQEQAAKDAANATQQALKDAAKVTTDAATGLVKLPTARMFELHDLCRVAGNGAPDCQSTATNACHGRGFGEGRPLGISTSQVCPTAVMLSGRDPAPGECRDETYLLGVYCQ